MSRPLYGLICCLVFPFILQAQRHPNEGRSNGLTGAISGTLIDSLSRKPVEYASVGVFKAQTQTVVNGGITDDQGNFKISGIPAGQYFLQITFIGFKTKTVTGIELTPVRPDAQVGKIMLAPENQLLDQVQIVGEAALIEAKPDKIVYNAERDVTSRGGDAADVLRKVPLLTVDFDGNLSMRGSENVRVLINGRPSSIFNANLADALKMMPADQIKSVEVITSPSAKYDGEGTAGIINIITRKKNIEGLAGSVDLTGGTRHNRGNMNLNYGKGRLGVNFSGGGHYSWPQEGSTTFRREETNIDDANLLLQDGTSRSSRLGFRTNAGIEYKINALSALSGTLSLRGHQNVNDNNVMATYSENNSILDSYRRIVDGESKRIGYEGELEYKRSFEQEDREWSIAIEYDRDQDKSNSRYDQQYSIPQDQASINELNLNKGNNLEVTLQTDYTHPITTALLIETGLKATLRSIESDFALSRYDSDLMAWYEDTGRTDIFFYNQNVYAGYASSTYRIGKKTTLIAGARLEATVLDGEFELFDGAFDNVYTNVLPNLTVSRKLGEFNQIKISYNQRIQRPNQRHINPFIEYSDNRDISFGNPSLTPELVHQLELGTNVFLKGNMISVSVFGRRTEDLIENLLRINEEGVSESTYENFGTRSALGVNVFGTLNLGKLSLRGGFDVNAWEVAGTYENEALTNSGFDYNGRMNATWELDESLKMEGFAFFRSPTYTVQGKNPNWSMMSFGIKKELFNKRLSVGLNITEPFRENQASVRELTGTDFYQYSRTLRPVRSFGISLGYRFGKLDFNDRQGRKKVNNNDLKEEDQGGENQFNGNG